ncbi:Lar family restriction alleviation protein [Pseudomonas mosselii]|uniref:Lar family restriction alleviation protein n=1 Tax=Pseudomonas mosselii TaxID=78327 RepID=UPI002023175D|nr:Lar family restriction alleviation protein [Pseudomonas mosselii]MCL8302321.1 Lar family restriction alleviation protein [Pseudomonas mosselii]
MSNELMPCPFCGQSPLLTEHPAHSHGLQVGDWKMPDHPGSWTIECPACSCGMIDGDRAAVVAMWNRRVPGFTAKFWRSIKLDPPAVGQCVVLAGPQGSDAPGRYWRLTGIRRGDGYYDSNGCGCDDATHWHDLLDSPSSLAGEGVPDA